MLKEEHAGSSRDPAPVTRQILPIWPPPIPHALSTRSPASNHRGRLNLAPSLLDLRACRRGKLSLPLSVGSSLTLSEREHISLSLS